MGFEKFCVNFNFDYEILSEFDPIKISKGHVFIIPNDRDLVRVIEQSKLNGLKIVRIKNKKDKLSVHYEMMD